MMQVLSVLQTHRIVHISGDLLTVVCRVILDRVGHYGPNRKTYQMADLIHGMIVVVSLTLHNGSHILGDF